MAATVSLHMIKEEQRRSLSALAEAMRPCRIIRRKDCCRYGLRSDVSEQLEGW